MISHIEKERFFRKFQEPPFVSILEEPAHVGLGDKDMKVFAKKWVQGV